MSLSADPGDRRILRVVAGALVALTAASFLFSTPPASSDGFPTTYSVASSGSKAAFLLLDELGFAEQRWEQPLTELPEEPNGTLLILADPAMPQTDEERQAVNRFLRAGGRILATGARSAYALPEAGIVHDVQWQLEWKTYRPSVPSPLSRGIREISMDTRVTWAGGTSGNVVIFGEEGQAVVVSYPVGAGRVVWWAAATPVTNAGLGKNDNLAFFLNVLGPPEKVHVLWDEYHHGFQGSLAAYLQRTPIPWATAQLALVFLAVVLTFGRRSGPVRPPLADSRLSPLEFVETLGDLYHHAHAVVAAVASAYQAFHFQVSRQLALPAQATPEQFSRALQERLPGAEPLVDETLKECQRAIGNPALREAQALHLIGKLHEFAEMLQFKSPKSGR